MTGTRDPEQPLSYSAALDTVLRQCAPLTAEPVAFDAVVGRVLAEDARAASAEPPQAKSAMDGFAVRSAETGTAAAARPVRFAYSVVVGAGHPHEAPVPAGMAVRIMTGAPLPAGVDAVVKLEDTREEAEGRFALLAPLEPGENVIAAGAILREGQALVFAGSIVTPQGLGLLAGQGRATWPVHRRPRVGLLSMGDELAAPGQPLAPGQLYVSNLYVLEALCRQYGAEPVRLGIVGDNPDAITAALRGALEAPACDVLLTLGGSRQGDFDFADRVLERIGARLHFRHTRINYGGSTLFATRERTLCFGLPGTPMASWLAFEVLVRPALWRLAGRTSLERPCVSATLTEPVRARPGRTHFIPAKLEVSPGHGPRVTPLAKGTPMALPVSVLANGLIRWPEDVAQLPAGSAVPVELLDLPAPGTNSGR